MSPGNLRRLASLGLSAEHLAVVLEVLADETEHLLQIAEKEEARKRAAADKKRRQRENKTGAEVVQNSIVPGTVPGHSRDNEGDIRGTVPAKEKVSRTLPKENNNPPIVPPKAAKPKKAMIAPDWEPSPEHIAAAAKEGLSLDAAHREARKFRDYHRSKGTTFVDWMAAWRNWIRKAVEINPNLKKGQNPDRHWLADTPGYGFG